MKKQLLVLLLSAIAASSYAQTTQTDLAVHKLKGKVKSVNETNYEAVEKFGELQKGNKTDRTYREFNSAGMETQYLQESYDDGEKEEYVRTIRYENNKPVESKEDDDGQVTVSRLKYNGQGLSESADMVDSKGTLMFRQKNKYNAEGLLVQADTYEPDGTLESKTVYSYNAKKELVKELWYDYKGRLRSEDTYVYDNRGHVVEHASINYEEKNPTASIYKYSYNGKDQKIEERNSIAGLDRKQIYEYNVQGDEVRKLDHYGGEEKKLYTYDGQNNWTKCVITKTSHGKTTHEIVERQVKYY